MKPGCESDFEAAMQEFVGLRQLHPDILAFKCYDPSNKGRVTTR